MQALLALLTTIQAGVALDMASPFIWGQVSSYLLHRLQIGVARGVLGNLWSSPGEVKHHRETRNRLGISERGERLRVNQPLRLCPGVDMAAWRTSPFDTRGSDYLDELVYASWFVPQGQLVLDGVVKSVPKHCWKSSVMPFGLKRTTQ